MEEPTDDFFEHIKRTLRNHEEEYREGAWEAFAQKQGAPPPAQKAPVIAIWKWVAVAAAMITGVLFAINYFTPTHKMTHPETVQVTPADKPFNPRTLADSNRTVPPDTPLQIAAEPPAIVTENTWNEQRPMHQAAPVYFNNGAKNAPLLSAVTLPFSAPQKIMVTTSPVQQATGAPVAPSGFWKNRIISGDEAPVQQQHITPTMPPNTMIAQNNPPQEKESNSSRKWIPSLFLSPMFAETGVNMGYGVSLAYAFNDKVRVSAGVAHNKITTSRDFGAASNAANPSLDAPGSGLSSFASKGFASNNVTTSPRLESVQGALSGFDIPLDVSYNISKKFYATAGVSGLIVVNDNTNYTIVTSTNTRISVENSQGILQEDKNIVTNTYSSASALPGDINHEKTSFLGFYNLSMGYKQKITPKNNVSIEPFLKVPVKSVTNQNLNYTGMGVRLKFDF